MTRPLRIAVDHDLCVGNAMCTAIAPQVFRLEDQYQASVADPGGDTLESVLEAAESCPVGAISVEDAETGAQLFPFPRPD